MREMGADISPLQNLLGVFFKIFTSYVQEWSTLINKDAEAKNLKPYLKDNNHLNLVVKEKYNNIENYLLLANPLRSWEEGREDKSSLRCF